jgi:hypothetical protein
VLIIGLVAVILVIIYYRRRLKVMKQDLANRREREFSLVFFTQSTTTFETVDNYQSLSHCRFLRNLSWNFRTICGGLRTE